MKSQQPFQVVLNDKSKQLLDLEEEKAGIIGLTFESVDGVKISDKYNSYAWELNKEILWVNPNGSIDKLQVIGVDKYTVNSGPYGSPGTVLSDGDIENYAKYLISNNEPSLIRLDFNEETEISAIQLIPCGVIWGQNLGNYFTKEIEIHGSTDGVNYSKLSLATNPTTPTEKQDPWNIVFYSAQKVKHIRIRTISTFQSSELNTPIFLAEIKVLK